MGTLLGASRTVVLVKDGGDMVGGGGRAAQAHVQSTRDQALRGTRSESSRLGGSSSPSAHCSEEDNASEAKPLSGAIADVSVRGQGKAGPQRSALRLPRLSRLFLRSGGAAAFPPAAGPGATYG